MEYVRFEDVEDINLKDWLLKQGFTKVKVLQEGRKYAFPSLFSSDDKKWRFSVSLLDNGRWVWCDHTIGKGGNIIDLFMMLNSLPSGIEGRRQAAISILKGERITPSVKQEEITLQNHAISVLETFPLFTSEKGFISENLCKQRRISKEIASRFCVDVKYQYADLNFQYIGMGFKNDRGGYEIRNTLNRKEYNKVGCSPKWFTTIKSSVPSAKFIIFEGFFDFLSFVEYYQKELWLSRFNYIVLNTTAMARHTFEVLRGATEINTFLDSDNAGDEVTELYQSEFGEIVHDKRFFFHPYNDFNEFFQKEGCIETNKSVRLSYLSELKRQFQEGLTGRARERERVNQIKRA